MIIRPLGPDRWHVEVFDWQRQLLTNLIEPLRDLLLQGSSPVLRRLYPAAYPGDAEADAAYEALVRDQLLEKRLEALDVVEASLDGGEFTDADLGAWMQAVNSLRLVLGTRLDVGEDTDPLDVADDDPDRTLWISYELLTQTLAVIVDALSEH